MKYETRIIMIVPAKGFNEHKEAEYWNEKQHPFIAYVKSHNKIQKRTNPLSDNRLNANQG
jgi:hypothetical protein